MDIQGLATKMWAKQGEYHLLLDDVENEIIKILGKPLHDSDQWGFEDITHDMTDRSFELKGCREPFILTDEQKQEFADLGFFQCWICTRPKEQYDPGTRYSFPRKAAP